MPSNLSREDLYALVWSKPITAAAEELQVSDVALAKRCRKANIPIPPRGWWAKKQAGKKVSVTPLPIAKLVEGNYFPAWEGRSDPNGDLFRINEYDTSISIPTKPMFRDLAVVKEEIARAVASLKFPKTDHDPHSIVVRLLEQDSKRNPSSGSRYGAIFNDERKFESTIQKRRLKILSVILKEAERLGCKSDGRTHAGEKISLNVNGYWNSLFLAVEGGENPSPLFRMDRSKKVPSKEQLRLDLVEGHDEFAKRITVWHEDFEPLENQLKRIMIEILCANEEKIRVRILDQYEWTIKTSVKNFLKNKEAEARAETERREKEKAFKAAQIANLISGADSFETADRIRRYVGAVLDRAKTGTSKTSDEALSAWSNWALSQADRDDSGASRPSIPR